MLSTQRAYVFCINTIIASLISLCAIQRLVFQMEEILFSVRYELIVSAACYIKVKISCPMANIVYEGLC
jgi:hypothetical protein